MMPSERRARLDLERTTGRTPGRLAAAERWPGPLNMVYHNHFPSTGATTPSEWSDEHSGVGAVVFIGAQAPTFWRMANVNGGAGSWSYYYLGQATAGSAMWGLIGFARDASMLTRCRWSTMDADAKAFQGLAQTAALGSTADGLFFGVDGAISNTKFICVARNGGIAATYILDGTGDKVDAPIDTEWHTVEIVCDSQNSQVLFYLDGDLAATIAEDLPNDSTDYLNALFSVQSATANQRYIDCDVIMLSEANP